jgi:hypothetical protein
MKKSHMFFVQFFGEDDWFRCYKPPHETSGEWLRQYEMKLKQSKPNKGSVVIRIEHQRLYALYKGFMKEFYISSKIRNRDTFFKELETMGIAVHPKRRNLNGYKRTCVDVIYDIWIEKMGFLYPGYDIEKWPHASNWTEFSKGVQNFINDRQWAGL